MWTLLLGLVFAAEGRNLALTAEPMATRAGVRLGAGRFAFDLRAGPLLRRDWSQVGQPPSTRTFVSKSLGYALTTQVRLRTSDAPIHGSWHVTGDTGQHLIWDDPEEQDYANRREVFLLTNTGPGIEAALGHRWAIAADCNVVYANHVWHRADELVPASSRTMVVTRMHGEAGLGGGFRVLLHYYPSSPKGPEGA